MRGILLAVVLFVIPSSLAANEPTSPADVAAKLQTLQPNEAVFLGNAAVVGEFNDTARRFSLDKTGPRGRDFTIKMVWAPERKRALYCGANHGVPHRLNDVWEFDLTTMTWTMLYAPDNARDYLLLGKDYTDVEFRDGILITKRGGPAIIGHTWWGVTYDTDEKCLLFMNTWVTNKPKAVELLGGDPAKLDPGPPLWRFYPDRKQWEFVFADGPYPKPIFGGWLEYVPEVAGAVWHGNNWQMQGTWLYRNDAGWVSLQPNAEAKNFAEQSPQPEQVGYYDPKRKLLIAQRGYDTFHYDVTTNVWKKAATSEAGYAPRGHDARAPMYYDPTSGHGLLVSFETDLLWAYDPDKAEWTRLKPTGDPLPTGNKRLAYFDQAHNVFVVIRDTNVWAYRYR